MPRTFGRDSLHELLEIIRVLSPPHCVGVSARIARETARRGREKVFPRPETAISLAFFYLHEARHK